MRPVSSYLQTKRSRAVLIHLFGKNDANGILLVIGCLIAVSWLGDVIAGLFHPLVLILLAIVVITFIYLRGREISPTITAKIEQRKPKQHPVLILFLSPSGKDKSKLENQDIYTKFLRDAHGRIAEQDVRKWFEGSWRMPLEAIAYHLNGPEENRLKKIVVLHSADAPDKLDGTYREYPKFRELIGQLVDNKKKEIEVIGLDDIDPRWQHGVDFEDAEALVNGALAQVFSELQKQNIPEDKVLIDVTGGQKVPTIAGAVFSLGEGRKLQYVSTRTFEVQSYDITYAPQES